MAAKLGTLAKITTWIAIAMSSYHLYTGAFGAPEALLHRSIHLMFTMVLIFSLYPSLQRKMGPKFRWTDLGDSSLLTLGIALGGILYLCCNYEYVITRYRLCPPP